MPTKPKTNQVLNKTAAEILNDIRVTSSKNYQDMVPMAAEADVGKNDPATLKEIGKVLTSYPLLQNEFLSALVNRIGLVLITSKLYENPWASFKKGMLEFGETVEELFVNIAHPFQFDPAVAENEVFKRVIPDVRAAFHIMNFQKFYKDTISNDQLRQAFLSWNGITDLIARIVDSMYTGANYDEFLVMKYLLARHLLQGDLKPITIPEVNTANMKQIVSTVKGTSNLMEFLSPNYNMMGVMNNSEKRDQYVILNAMFDAAMDVEVLASAFNMDRAQFMGNRILVDSFGALDNARLAELFKGDPTYKPLTEAELQALDLIPMVVVDRDFFMIFDNFQAFTEIYNNEGLYWNYTYHVWKTFSVSPFANAVAFIPDLGGVTSVTVTGPAQTPRGGTYQYVADVQGEFVPKTVTWSLGVNRDGLSIDANTGLVTVTNEYPAGESAYSIRATSTYDTTKFGTFTATVPA